MKIHITILFIIAVFMQCSDKKNPVSGDQESGIAFYFLKDMNLSVQDVLQKNLNSLELKPTPWLTSEDILMYDFSTHLIYLKEDKEEYIQRIETQNDNPLIPFVVKASNQSVYLAALYTQEISFVPPCPTIQRLSAFEEIYPQDVCQIINFMHGWTEGNVLENEIFKAALIQSSIYHGGIALNLNTVAVVENADTSTIKYTFTYENKDSDDLFVLDPDLMPPEIFNCFSSGIVFRNDSTYSVTPIYEDACSLNDPYNFNTSWYTGLQSGKKLTRTVTLKGYPRINKGNYICDFYLSCMVKIESSERYSEGYRYWIGAVRSNEIQVEY